MNESLIGRSIGEFVIEEHIGYSALSAMYRARQTSLNRKVLIKILGLENPPTERASFLRNFMEQAGVITQLEHLHILPIFDYGVVGEEFAYLATRLMAGKLSTRLYERPISLNRAAFIVRQIADALDYATSQGVVHGSINPGNIYLDERENAYLDDYEMSRIGLSARSHSELLQILGTPTYASPEQLRLRPIDHKSDIYSLGAIAYRMVTNRSPFELSNGGVAELLQLHDQNALVPPARVNPDIPPELNNAILRAMHENPTERFKSAGELATAFEKAVQQPPPERRASTPPAQNRAASPPTQTAAGNTLPVPAWVVGLVILLIAALLVVTALLLTRP